MSIDKVEVYIVTCHKAGQHVLQVQGGQEGTLSFLENTDHVKIL